MNRIIKIIKKKRNSKVTEVQYEYIGDIVVPKNVTHIQFHPSVVKVRVEAFECRDELREVVLNDGLREIGRSAFQGCVALQSIEMPSTVTEIGNGAFYCCNNLVEVVLNDGLREIGELAFQDCSSLQSINIPSTVTKIGSFAFRGCTGLNVVVLNEGITEIGEYAFYNCSSLRSITIPSTVTEIDKLAFANCTEIKEIVLNDGLREIGYRAFANCKALQSINIPSTAIHIEQYAFRGCGSLTTFQDCSSLESITIPSTVIEIGDEAFRDCTELREVVIHNEKVQISFLGCTSLERFKFPSISTRLNTIIQVGHTDIEAKMDDIPAVEWRGGELAIPVAAYRQRESSTGTVETLMQIDKEKLVKVEELIAFYEMKESTTLFELALWILAYALSYEY